MVIYKKKKKKKQVFSNKIKVFGLRSFKYGMGLKFNFG